MRGDRNGIGGVRGNRKDGDENAAPRAGRLTTNDRRDRHRGRSRLSRTRQVGSLQ